MSYLDESGLSTYDSNLKEWISSQDSKTITSSIYPWAKTAKADAVSCYPVGGTELKPVVDFLFTETPPASGDKGPENPSTISGVSSMKVTRCGKNLISTPYNYGPSFTQHGYTITENQDGSLTLNGSSDGQGACHFNLTSNYSFKLHAGVSYAASITNINNLEVILQGFNSVGSIKFTAYADGTPRIFTLNNDEYVTIRMSITKFAGTLANAVVRPQLELGTAVTDFEPYAGTDYTIPLGNTYYGGTLDVASGVMTVTHWGIALDGQNDGFTLHSSSTAEYSYFQWANIDYGLLVGVTSAVCSHFTYDYNLINTNTFAFYSTSGTIRLKTDATEFPDATAFKTWLATQYNNGTPVVFCMALAANKRYTVQLDPVSISALVQADKYTPRLNTVYTDASAVQVGYVKSPIREEQELTQAIVSQGGNI